MPSLQSIVSAWTKINHDHVEYFSDADGLQPLGPDGLRPQGQTAGGGVPPPGPGGAGAAEGDDGVAIAGVGVGVGHPGAIIPGGAIDPRTTTYQPSPASSSSLSLYSFSKNGVVNSVGATAETNSLTAATTSAAAPMISGQQQAAIGAAIPAPSQRYPLYHHSNNHPSSSASVLSSQLSSHDHRQRHEMISALAAHDAAAPRIHHRSSSSSSSSRRSHHQHNNLHQQHHQHHAGRGHGGAGSGGHGSALHGQLESYSQYQHHHHQPYHHHSGTRAAAATKSSNNFDSFPPPQAGADAILGRRKSNNNNSSNSNNNGGGGHPSLVGRIDSSTSSNLGEPPASLLPHPSSSAAADAPAAKHGGLARSQSSSLWHSSRSSNSSSRDSRSQSSGTAPGGGGGGGGATSVTASLERMSAGAVGGAGGGAANHRHIRPSAQGGAMAGHPRPPASAAAIAELNATAESALRSMNSLGSNQQQQQQQQQQLQGVLNNVPSAAAMPTPQRSKSHRRQRLKKSHSRTDLVREMAMDRGYAGGRQKHRGSTMTTSSTSTTLVGNLNMSSGEGNELDASGESTEHSDGHRAMIQSQHEQQQQQQSQTQFMMSAGGAMGENKGMTRRSSADSGNTQSINNSSASSSLGDDNNRGRTPPYGTLHDPQSNFSMTDPFAENDAGGGGVPPGGHWMKGWFPNQPLPGQRRQSSSGSSGTAITGNRGFDMPGGSSNVNENLDKNNMGATTSSPVEQQTPHAAATANANNNIADAGGPLPVKRQPGVNGQIPIDGSNCDRCALLESTLLSLQADLEYLRTMELQREFVCKECDNGSNHRGTNNNPTTSLPPIDQKIAYNPHVMPSSSGQSVSSAVSIGSRGSRASSARNLHRRKSAGGGAGSSIGGPRTQATNFSSRTSMFLRDASKRLSDLSTRHKRQVKQTTHERAYWQNDMHLKLEKFALMCKNLNEEAAHRSNEVKETKALLNKMTSERNALVSQVDTLRARVELYEGESVGQSRLREEWEKEKGDMLDSIDRAMKDRDETIEDVSNRLELAVETIENERKQQRMRRQIIFPPSRSLSSSSTSLPQHAPKLDMVNGLGRQLSGEIHGMSSSSTNANDAPSSPHYRPNSMQSEPTKTDIDYLERIQKTNEVAKKARMSLKATMVQSAARENATQSKLKCMERELAEARRRMAAMAVATGRGSDDNDQEVRVPLNEDGGGGRMSIRRISSTTSLGSLGGL